MRRHASLLIVLLTALAPLVVGGCRGAEDSAPEATPASAKASEPGGELQVHDATLSLPSPAMGAAYFLVTNPGSAPDRLVGITSDQVASADLHETIDDDGVMRMVPRPDGLEIPAGGRLELTPGGAHVMLMDPRPVDGTIELTLTFETHEPIVLHLAAPESSGGTGDAGHGESGDHQGHGGHAS